MEQEKPIPQSTVEYLGFKHWPGDPDWTVRFSIRTGKTVVYSYTVTEEVCRTVERMVQEGASWRALNYVKKDASRVEKETLEAQ